MDEDNRNDRDDRQGGTNELIKKLIAVILGLFAVLLAINIVMIALGPVFAAHLYNSTIDTGWVSQ